MVQIILVGIGAGLAAALLFSAPISGTSLALPLFAVTGMPIAIAALGWTTVGGAVAVAAGAAAVFAFLSPLSAVVFLFLFGLPMAWIAYLAGLWRQDGEDQQWFPIGRILAHAAAATAIGLTVVGYVVGYHPETMAESMVKALSQWLASSPDITQAPSRDEIEPFVRLNVALLPYTLAAIVLINLAINLWLAGLVTRASSRLARPRERLWTVSLPLGAALAFIAALAASMMPFPLGDIAALTAGAFGGALLLLGLAVLHALTLGMNGRTALLTLNYIALVLLGFTVLVIIALGIAEILLNLRERRFGGTPPPT